MILLTVSDNLIVVVLRAGTYLHCYPLHGGRWKKDYEEVAEAIDSEKATEDNYQPPHYAIRRLLFLHWASFRKTFKLQPLQLIQDYFGVQVWAEL